MLAQYHKNWYKYSLMQKTHLAKTLLTASALFAFAFFVSACAPQQSETSTPNTDDTNLETETSGVSSIPTTAGEQIEGETLSTTETYQSPAGPEEVKFTLVVDEAGTIVDAHTEVLAKSPISVMRQEAFAAEFPTAIEGKKLASLTAIDRVGGSSLTTKAFNEAIVKFQQQAQ